MQMLHLGSVASRARAVEYNMLSRRGLYLTVVTVVVLDCIIHRVASDIVLYIWSGLLAVSFVTVLASERAR